MAIKLETLLPMLNKDQINCPDHLKLGYPVETLCTCQPLVQHWVEFHMRMSKNENCYLQKIFHAMVHNFQESYL